MTRSKTDMRTLNSARHYLDQLFANHAKLQVIRLDLSHKKDENGSVNLQELKRDVTHLLANRRSKPSLFEALEGYVVKYEAGEDRGPHVHTVLLFDGHKLQKDSHRADQIGQYWVDTITEGKGTFHNVNRHKGRFERCGIGMIDHADVEKRQALMEDVLPYLAKVEQSVESIKASTKERAFTRGTMPKPKSKAGRPRKTETESEESAVTTEGDSEDKIPTID